nr:uncharacterized protein LOC124810841 isoform X1 [Hydra vulgaris]XP_047131830.1 uncharacterized protein LOC124810841 isoform X1 [Hydra vulgaris]
MKASIKLPWLSQSQTVTAVLKPANTSRLAMTTSSCSQCHLLAPTVQKYRDEIAAMTMQAEERAHIKKEDERMKQILCKLNDDLPKMFGFMQQSLTSALSQSSSECLDNSSPIILPEIASFAAHKTTLSKSVNNSSANQQKNQQLIANSLSTSSVTRNAIGVQQVDEIDLGLGVTVSNTKLSMIKSTRATHLARLLMDLIFTQEEMEQSSVTGRVSNSSKVAKQALNPSKVAALLAYVHKQFPGVDNRMIKQSMAEKLQDVGKIKRRQMKGNIVDENEPEDTFLQ